MNFKKILSIVVLAISILTSCDDQIMEWGKDPSHGEITSAELPLKLAEAISRYKALNTYTDMRLGVGIGMDLYVNNETYRNIANSNFDEATVGYAMKHAVMVQSDGSLDFEPVDNFMTEISAAGLTVYGHTLLWHQNQNASYLNSLIAPTVIPGSAGSNSLDLTGLKNGSLSGWGAWNSGEGITIENGSGLADGQAVKLISSSSSSDPWSLQLQTPDIIVDSSHTYEISFYIKSDKAGEGRISFDGLENNYPWKDWYNTGGSWTESFATNSEWQQVKITVNDFTGTTFKFNFDLGYLPDVTYYIDVNTITVVDNDAEPTVNNLITNGDFEDGTLGSWSGWGNSSTRVVSAEGSGYNSSYCMTITNPSSTDSWSCQQAYDFDAALTQDQAYTLTMWIKADNACTIQALVQNPTSYAADYSSSISVGTTWTYVELTITPTTTDRTRFLFNLGSTATTYYIDDIVFTDGKAASSDPVIIEKTDEEKAEIIKAAMEDWISQMVSHYKDKITAWDVLNEPMESSGEVRTDYESDDSDAFPWMKYLGKDYGLYAFQFARKYGNANDLLFINDYNLEYNLTKCQGLIDYVKYLENKGVTIDGIGTQMHISIESDTTNIKKMFELLAGSGKQIKVSELDLQVNTKSPTSEQLAQQYDMYRFVIDMYKKYIPEAQQYGITIWGISDNEKEHKYWLPDDAPNLWDANYARKHAYKGVADGLAGYDVSSEFTGELQ